MMNVTVLLRPVHAWFFLWERLLPSIYRVVATGLAALATAALLVAFGLPPLVAAPISLLVWICLAVAQEHDERITLPPDHAFVAALSTAVSEPPLRLTVDRAEGPCRARPEPWDTFVVLSAKARDGHPLGTKYIEVRRCAARGRMQLHVSDDAPGSFEPVDDALGARGQSTLIERIKRAESPDSDARAIAAALVAAYW